MKTWLIFGMYGFWLEDVYTTIDHTQRILESSRENTITVRTNAPSQEYNFYGDVADEVRAYFEKLSKG